MHAVSQDAVGWGKPAEHALGSGPRLPRCAPARRRRSLDMILSRVLLPRTSE